MAKAQLLVDAMPRTEQRGVVPMNTTCTKTYLAIQPNCILYVACGEEGLFWINNELKVENL